jgi:NAD(P)-dependent dehydrogenase (short-subunit alcohol dehydrogenase family)
MTSSNGDRLGRPGTPVVVTGGASGIGREVCRALAEVGRPVAAWDLNGAGAKAVADECAAEFGVTTTSYEVDVLDADAINAGVQPTLAALGGVGGLVHAAGISMAPGARPLDATGFDTVLQVNLRAEATLVQAFLPELRAAQPGSAIVGIASIEGLIGHGAIPAYTASKHGVIGLTRALAHALGSERIRVNAVCPGYIETPMFAPALSMPGARESYLSKIPLQRLGMPQDIARLVRFLLSDEAEYIHGSAVVADGGVTAAGGQEFAGAL